MNAVTQTQEAHPLVVLREQLGAREAEFKAALPAHIPVERFMRVLLTAVQNNPALLKVERRSLWNSAMKSAQDGLLPDGREGAIVIYRDRQRGEIGQWMPMIAGIRKKVRNSGEIATWDAHVVHENDAFEYELGDEPFIRHRPALANPGKVIAAYSVAVLKTGEKSREVMSIDAINAIRSRSRAKDSGPWVTDFAEMCRKTVARRHSKVLPMSTDLDDLLRRDDDLYDMQGASDRQIERDKPKTLAGRMDALAAPVAVPLDMGADPQTGEVIDQTTRDSADESAGAEGGQQQDGEVADTGGFPSDDGGTIDPIAEARARGAEAREAGLGTRAMPGEYRAEGREAEAAAWMAGHQGAQMAEAQA